MLIVIPGPLLRDLSKAFDYLKHELHISKLSAYEFNLPTLKLIHDYFSDRKQRVNSYNDWLSIIFGVSQGLVLELLLLI